MNHSLFDKKEVESSKVKLHRFLQATPYLCFSDTGLSNIAKRFNITLEELKEHIKEYESSLAGRSNNE